MPMTPVGRDLTNGAPTWVSKMLWCDGRVYGQATTWTTAPPALAVGSRSFDEAASELAFGDLLAAVDGPSGREAAYRALAVVAGH